MTTDQRFPELVSLACHDLRTPLATVTGFAATLLRTDALDEQSRRYVTLIESASMQLGEIIDDLSVLARVTDGRFEPSTEPLDSLELARDAAARVPHEKGAATGTGAPVAVDARLTTRAVAALATAALRHGALEAVEIRVDGRTLHLPPVNREATAVVLGESPRDLGALAGSALIAALGGKVERRGDAVSVALPAPE